MDCDDAVNGFCDKLKVVQLFENEDYRLVGLPFYNEQRTKKDFKDKLEEVLTVKT